MYPHAPGGNVRQIHGRPGEVWGALSAHDKLLSRNDPQTSLTAL